MNNEKPIYWVGTSYKDLLSFPEEAKREAGYQLHRVQNGLDPEDWKPFNTAGSGVKEIRISEDKNIFRVMYVAKFAEKFMCFIHFKRKHKRLENKILKLPK